MKITDQNQNQSGNDSAAESISPGSYAKYHKINVCVSATEKYKNWFGGVQKQQKGQEQVMLLSMDKPPWPVGAGKQTGAGLNVLSWLLVDKKKKKIKAAAEYLK